MFFTKKIQHDNLTIRKVPEYKELVGIHNRLSEPVTTGDAIIEVPTKITSPDKMIEYAIEYVKPYSTLLSFAQDHDIHFNHFRCFKIEDKKTTVISSNSFATRYGEPWGLTNIYALDEFLAIAVPLLTDKAYNEKTSIERGLIFYNEGVGLDVIELQMIMLFVGLETLANAHYDHNVRKNKPQSTPQLIDDKIWASIRKLVKNSIPKDNPNRQIILSRLGEINAFEPNKDPPIEEKIKLLCTDYGLPKYSKEIDALGDMRNDILHGRPMRSRYDNIENFDVMASAQRLLAKLILKILNFFVDWPKVHGSLISTDLWAQT